MLKHSNFTERFLWQHRMPLPVGTTVRQCQEFGCPVRPGTPEGAVLQLVYGQLRLLEPGWGDVWMDFYSLGA